MGDAISSGSSRSVTAQELQSYERLRQSLSQLPVPTLQRRDNPHEYLFLALFDGTGQDVNNPQQFPSNVGVLSKQANALERSPNNQIGTHYVKGIGTQENYVTRLRDKAFAFSWDERIKEMYLELAKHAAQWQREDPEAQIRIAEVGYSRGGVLVPGFARLVDQYGIVDPSDLKFGRDQHGNITIETTRQPLVAPGQVAQAVGLFDPVATGFPEHYGARLPPSVISALALLAKHERREPFAYQTIIDLGMTPDGRAANLVVPGGHSNVGGGNRENGLEILNGNLMIDYLNLLSDRPLFEKRPVPTDPAMMTVYQVQGVTAGFGTRMDRDGQRDLREELANCKIVDPCRDSEPVDAALARRFPRRHVDVEPAHARPAAPQVPASTQDKNEGTHGFDRELHREINERMRNEEGPVQSLPRPPSRSQVPAPSPPQPVAALLIPELPHDFRDSHHPQHVRYAQTLVAVHAMEGQRNIPHGVNSERVAAVLVDHMHKERFQELAWVELRGDGPDTRIVAVQAQHTPWSATKEVALDPDRAMARSVEQSSLAWAERALPHLRQPATPVETQAPSRMQSQFTEHDLRNPQHPEHALHANVRGQVASAYAAAGLPRTQDQVDHATAAVALNMRRNQMTHAEAVLLTPDPRTGVISANSPVIALQGEHSDPRRQRTVTTAQDLQRTAEDSYQQMAQLAQQQAVEQTLAHQQREDRVQQRGNGMVMG